MSLNSAQIQHGATLVEIMISLAVLGILLLIGLPSFGAWLQNQQLRAASEAALSGLQTARGEAIRRNLSVRIAFGPGTGWTVKEVTSGTVIQTRVHQEGSPNATLTAVNGPPATAAAVPPDLAASAVTFSSLGGITANADGSPSVTKIDVANPAGGACQPTGAMRCLRLTVSAGGSVKMCDPLVASPDPRTC
jgi:type IV fimbrial biogenesis protein FimT